MAHRADKTAAFVGLLSVKGSVESRKGTFVLQITGTFDGQAARGKWTVVAGLGTGELRKLGGEGGFEAPLGPAGTYTLAYDLE